MMTYRITWMVILALSMAGIALSLTGTEPRMAWAFLVPLLMGPYAIWSARDGGR